MKRLLLLCVTAFFLFSFLSPDSTFPQDHRPVGKAESPKTAAGLPRWSLLNINNLTTWMRSDGQSNHSPTAREGAYFPRGTRWTLYQDGLVWGGRMYLDPGYTIPPPTQAIRVGGATYNIGTREGRVIGFGATAVPQNPADPDVRIYRIRRDYAQMSDAALRQDAADYFEIPVSSVTSTQMDDIRNQYALDWTGWPVAYGAPYIERNNTPGYQQPPPFSSIFTVDSLIAGGYDEPGLAGRSPNLPAGQVLWTVMNDLDSAATLSLYGSHPVGLEVQTTLWGYSTLGPLGQTYFKRYRLINKGGGIINHTTGARGNFYIDSMYVAQWTDPDLGAFSDDLSGCDTLLSSAFVYNGYPIDNQYQQVNLPPPAFGYSVAQGPLFPAAPGDSGIFNFKRVYGKKNRPMTSFAYFSTGSALVDPPYGTYEASLRWWKMLRGYVPDPSSTPDRYYPFPPGYTQSPFPFSGDPVATSGFLDGLGTTYSLPPGDRRFVINSGPFRLAPGDTQEVIFSATGGISTNHRSSITAMKQNTIVARQVIGNLLVSLPPPVTSNVTFPNSSDATVRLWVDGRGMSMQSMQASLIRKNGTSAGSISLYDDGTHGDTLAGDGIWTNSTTMPRQAEGLSVSLTVNQIGVGELTWDRIHSNVTTAGPLLFRSLRVYSDNMNDDGKANPGEKVRYGFTIASGAAVSLSGLSVTPTSEEFMRPRPIGSISPGGIDSMVYNPGNDQSYFTITIPSTYPDSLLTIFISVSDTNRNLWTGSLNLRVYPLAAPVQQAVLNHAAGFATGEFEIAVVDPLQIRNHLYVIRGIDSANGTWYGFTLKDSTDGRILLPRQVLPDSFGFSIPVTDGFRLRRGTLPYTAGVSGWDVPSGAQRFTWLDGGTLGFEGFNGTIGWNEPNYFFMGGGQKTVPAHRLRNVLLKLANASSGLAVNPNTNIPYGGWDRNSTTDPNMSYGYRYLRGASLAPALPEFAQYIISTGSGYKFQDYKKGVPFSAWNIDADPPQRLAVGFLENNYSRGLVDGLYWPPPNGAGVTNIEASGPREWFFIFDAPYTGAIPDTDLSTRNLLNDPTPVMYWGTVNRLNGTNFFAGDEFLIRANIFLSSQDVWTFNPTIVVSSPPDDIPGKFALSQNYPNPFNPSTTVRYSLAARSNVIMKVYNILGQEVRTLVNEVKEAGSHLVVWNGMNNSARRVASGVYFYRLEAGSFTQARKMLLIK